MTRSRSGSVNLKCARLPLPGMLRTTMSIIGTTIFLGATSPACASTAGRPFRLLFRRSCRWNHGSNRSHECARSEATRLYLPHFGLVEGDLAAHFDALDERVRRWADWFRDELRKGRGEAELIPDFARYEAQDILASGAAQATGGRLRTSRPKFHGRDGVDSLLAKVSSRSVESRRR